MRFAVFAFSSSVFLGSGLLAAQPAPDAPPADAPPADAPPAEAGPPPDATPAPEAPPAASEPPPSEPPASPAAEPAPAPAVLTAAAPATSTSTNATEKRPEPVEITVAGSRLNRAAGPIKLPFTLAYTYTRSKFMSAFDSADPIYGSVQRGDELPYIPRQQGSITLAAELDYGGVALAGYHVDRMREEAASGSLDDAFVTDAQNWLDVNAFVKPFKALSIYGNLRNVTGEASIAGRRPFGARPNAPRWLQVGAKLAF